MRNFKPVLRNVEVDSTVRTGSVREYYKGLHQYYTMTEFEELVNMDPDQLY